jgi:hypothetical protein
MILAMGKRRRLWQEALEAILNYVIDANVRAGRLAGTEMFDTDTRRNSVTLPEDMERTLEFTWPELESESVKDRVESLVAADSTGKIPPHIMLRLMLQALGVEDVDEIVKEMTDDQGNFRDPELQRTLDAVRRFRQGEQNEPGLSGNEPPEPPVEEE